MTTGNYEKALAETSDVLRSDVVEHPFIDLILRGELTEGVYAAYLRETYHLVQQTPYFLSAAASRAAEGWLQDWFLNLAIEERHHDRLCVQDLRRLGYDTDTYLSGLPGLGTWTMVGQNHWLVSMKDPAALIGFAAATEGLGASLGPKVTEAMAGYPFARTALNFLKVHSEEDQEHIELVRKAFDRAATTPERYQLMVTAWSYTLRAYGQLFTDAMTTA
ncbi:long-chain acyl-CoA synthetase [Pseudonocardia sp. Ae406_Ps2]|uniref:iron-containing redox enzyme family protein n=1 Tax=unclassified Pseudonocardia TaxID=2619320 RepID=UPI00094B2AA7|nr:MULTISPECIES: iron-containing redox enzyme family protein [unclassified Pseudonocardia]OLM00545.1 long-chain acyl-CoA synthetase [Pseudonocardia sp. Ae406_Ps2]OLM07664.1 long-chain acyl-CoA synthetase [Pseudonocardia sp. Ae331_Ps2]OLM22117.1 long-chain acyl-CoA synthetase [Pseudonocardia sp. Ae706_Ps2]OLM31190.1 long-chain acyl-CoA synthetase [Pseudonocardia sp. Ae717_Ps2]